MRSIIVKVYSIYISIQYCKTYTVHGYIYKYISNGSSCLNIESVCFVIRIRNESKSNRTVYHLGKFKI
jgi:hypothetical protein